MHSENNSDIFITFVVVKFFKSIRLSEEHPLNIPSIFLTFFVLKPSIFKLLILLQ